MIKKIRMLVALLGFIGLSVVFSTDTEASIEDTTTAKYVVDGEEFKVEVGKGYEYLLEEVTVSLDKKNIPLSEVDPIEKNDTTYSNSSIQPLASVSNGSWIMSGWYYVPSNAVTYGMCYSNIAASKSFGCYRGNTVIIRTSGSSKNLSLSGVRIFTAGQHQWRAQNTSSVRQEMSISVSF